MTPPQKPEWIELADKDISMYPRKVSKGLPVMALVVTASIIGAGTLFAQSSQEYPAGAVEIASAAVQNSSTASAINPETNFAPTSNDQATVSTSKIAFTSHATSTNSSMLNPSISTMPTAGDDDEDEDEYEGDDDEYEGDDD